MKEILADFHRVLKPGGTLHVIVPDLHKIAVEYVESYMKGDDEAADQFISNSILSKSNRGKLRYRLMEFHGGFGLQHRWMYDQNSMRKYVTNSGFEVKDHLDVPSKDFRKNDDSVHVFAVKI
jgi:predicted SAM-dependent methyltransferase